VAPNQSKKRDTDGRWPTRNGVWWVWRVSAPGAGRTVVPSDERAIERAAEMLCHEGLDYADGWVQGDTDRDYPRLIAEAVLRAAGETFGG
jgi:hypothetical protein